SHGIPQIGELEIRVFGVLAVVRRNDAIFAVSTAGVATGIDKDHVFLRLDDSPGRTLTRNPQGLASHDGVIFVGPHVELLNFVPVLRLIYWTTQAAEPRGRVKL